jgi:DNA-3-methyladenine glycosylase II
MSYTLYFEHDSPAICHLNRRDRCMANLIAQIGSLELSLRTDYFANLVRAIVGQQLSAKVARVIWERLMALCEVIEPEVILGLDDESLKQVGLSRTKVCYIKDLAQKVGQGTLQLDALSTMADEDIIKALTTVKGIGKWTAEMFLIFSLGRPDILALDDVGLQRAMRWVYNLPEYPKGEVMKQYGEKWRPYRSVASLYLWEAVDLGLVTGNPR